MTRAAVPAVLILLMVLVGPGVPVAQGPRSLPLVQSADVSYLGAFTIPNPNWESTTRWDFGGFALGMGPDGRSLYMGGHSWYSRLGRVSIPSVGESAVEQIAPLEVANLRAIDADDPNGITLGGSMVHGGRLIVSGYAYYDADGDAESSHFVATPDMKEWTGPYRVGKLNPGFVGGYMGAVPPDWHALLGGPALTGQCCISIISRSSFGPSVSVFNPDDLGTKNPVPAQMLLGYPQSHPELGRHQDSRTLFNAATLIGGIAFVPGTRSLLFIGRQGDGPICYGPGTRDTALAGKPDGQGNLWCLDPADDNKGFHAYPYRHFVWAYDANDLAAVKSGGKDPWQLRPYATWYLDGANDKGTAKMRSATFDPVARRLYVIEDYGSRPRVHVWQVREH